MPIVRTSQPRPSLLRNILTLGVALLLAACQPAPQEAEMAGEVQGTTYHIKVVIPPNAPLDTEQLKTAIEARFADIDVKLSNYRQDSEISKLNQQRTTEWMAVSKDIADLLVIARQVYVKSDGCYDLTVKPLFDLWGFSRHQGKVPPQAEIDKLLPHIGLNQVDDDPVALKLRRRDSAIMIDLSSIAQGYTVAAVATLLEDRGIQNYMAEIGGEMRVKGRKANGDPWRIAVEKPTPFTREVQKILSVRQENGTAIMTSGTYRNFFDEGGHTYSHIIDPKTGKPVDHHLLSVTVMHDDPTWADAWSTALLCLGEEKGFQLAESEGLKALFIYDDNHTLKEKLSSAMLQSEPKE